MELVIDIDDNIYKSIKNNCYVYQEEAEEVALSIIGGITLPKGHGRLVDADRVIKKMEEREEKLKDDRSIWETAGVETALNMFGETIIEADRSNEVSVTPSYNSIKTELKSCEDCISRQAVLDVIEREEFKGDAISEIEKLSSVTPQPKTGHWNRVTQAGHLVWECDKCKWQQRFYTNYCSDCGAKMTENEE